MRTRYFLLFLLLTSYAATGQLRLPEIIGDGMVLQRDKPLTIWGWTDPGAEVNVDFAGHQYNSEASGTGVWEIRLPSQPAGGPHAMTIISAGETRVIQDILFGDVWLCAGQSNMVHYLELHQERFTEEIAAADYPQIRQFLVPNNPVLTGPSGQMPETSWKSAKGEDVLRFSVVAYFFAKSLHEEYGIPIGIINASVGGTPVEAWTSEEGLREFPEITERILRNKDTARVNAVNRKAQEIRNQFQQGLPEDNGLTGSWFDPDYKDTSWKEINIPGFWEDQGLRDLNGVVWFRKEVELPRSVAGKAARVKLGRIVDADRLYVNGRLVGQTYYQYPQRRYEIPAGVLKPGKNTLAVRVVNNFGKGGFVPDKPYYLVTGNDTADLKGYWKYQVGAVYPDPPRAGGIAAQNQPAALFNGMIAPYIHYSIKGAAWYQGESNAGRPEQYARLLPALITDWRNQWQMPEMPFLFVQLPNFLEVNYYPEESNWAQLRESQRQTLKLPHTAMVVAIDLGEWNDIHPGNKKPIGDRLALAARHLAYGEDITYSGPQFSDSEVEEDRVILHFDHAADGLIAGDGGELKWFALAGPDKEFRWADARINGESVILENVVQDPVYVRYAWADNPSGGLLYNKAGLPASPFGITIGNPNAARDSIYSATRTDHQQMMEQLGIENLRKGPSGNPNAPDAANTDETKVRSYELPDPLQLENGKQVRSAKMWKEQRREEILELFDREIYGRIPENMPDVDWQVVYAGDTMIGNYPARKKMLAGIVNNSDYPEVTVEIELQVVTPKSASQAVPLIMEFGFIRWPWGTPPSSGNQLFSSGEPSWKEQVLSRGWGYAILVPGSIQADNGAGLHEGIIGLTNKGSFRSPEDWGALRAWAWGASRAMDYLESDPDVDAGRVAIEGLSRYGKAALVAMAYEPRFSMGFIGSSGAGGAKLMRRNFGEQVENLASSGEYHWFAGNFLKYASVKTVDELPADAHELIALCAPRPVFISAGSPHVEGSWIDARGMFEAAVSASPVYELMGQKGLGTIDFPPLGQAVMDGDLAFRQHAGGHSTGPNWSTFLAWACRYWGDCNL